MTDYKAHYRMLNAEYVQLIQDILANPASAQQKIPRVTTLAGQIATVLDEAAKEMALIPNPPNDLAAERDELVKRLQQIQRDYSGLLQNTDKIETLRRIRSYQDESWRPSFAFHLIAFFVLAVTLFLVILFVRQRENTAMSPTSAAISPTFT
jgi:hypothetical protein